MLLAGAAGGLTSFLAALRAQHYKNNKYIAKSVIEISGGAVTAVFLSYLFLETSYIWVIAFLIGSAWSQIVQRVRTRITRIVEAALGDTGKDSE
jgi:hypothetical protein